MLKLESIFKTFNKGTFILTGTSLIIRPLQVCRST